jgi:uncharacterized DUF497 family protein
MYNSRVRFSWDAEKAADVEREHHIEFARIIDIFSDPYAVEFEDVAHSTVDETRYAIIGLTGYGLVYLVYTEQVPDELHFITARLAEP